MAVGVIQGRFQFYDGTKEELEASDLILLKGEIALERNEETNSIKMRVGDGKSTYADCPYIDIGTYSVESLRDEDIDKIRGPKGDKGDPFTADDFTPSQWLDLKGEPGKDGSDATITAGKGLDKSGDTISVDDTVAFKSDLTGFAKSADIPKMVSLTQADYDKLSDKAPETFYFIIGG